MKEIIILAFLASQLITNLSTRPSGDKFKPPGTVEIVDNFFVDEGEIRNADWREYVLDIKERAGEDSELYKQALPDTEVWLQEGNHMQPFVDLYFWHPRYDDHPVVGVTHSQAVAYCNWRTEAVNKMLARLEKKVTKKFQYRLPSQTEWELVANATYTKKQRKLVDKKKEKFGKQAMFHNMLTSKETHGDNSSPAMPTETICFIPNSFGVYNMNGNVAEMVAEPGVAMGGSYRHSYEDIVPTNKALTYDGPKNWLGFRCVCEIMEE